MVMENMMSRLRSYLLPCLVIISAADKESCYFFFIVKDTMSAMFSNLSLGFVI